MIKVNLPVARHLYKDTWNAVSDTEPSAKIHIMGIADEVKFRESAVETVNCLRSTVGVFAGDTVLEVGCGIGRVGQELIPLCHRWIGCDVSSNMLEHAVNRLGGYLDRIELVEISGFDLHPIQDESCSLVYCTVVFMHLDEWDRYNYVREAFRVLKPAGRIFIDNFNLCSDEGFKVFMEQIDAYPRIRPPHISKSSTPQEFLVYLSRAGFKDIEVRERGLWLQGWGFK